MNPAAEHGGRYLDAWSRPAPKYRIRAALMILIMSALFAGLCCFTFWLRTGAFAPWQYERYPELIMQSLRPLGHDQVTLSDFLSRPIPVQEVPIHAVIMGLLFASLCSIPVMVTILYRLPFAVPFAGMVFALAGMPWLAVTVMIGCTLAAIGHSRITFRYASALIGLLPAALYFVTASWEPAGAPSAMAENQALLYAPWVLAMLSSCVICAVALAIARLINYRPGGMPPVLALLFALPVVLFYAYVGRDELEFRILENEYGPGTDSVFATVDLGALAQQAATARWSETSSGSYDDLFLRIYQRSKSSVLRRVEQQRYDAIDRCNRFIENFPASRYIPDVLYLKARAQDYRLNRSRLKTSRLAEFSADMPYAASRVTWMTLVEKFPDYNGTAAARYNLALLSAANGDFDTALAHLDELMLRFDSMPPTPPPAGSGLVDTMFQRRPPGAGRQINVTAYVERGRKLREMLLACKNDAPVLYSHLFGERAAADDPPVGPLQLLLSFDPLQLMYRTNLDHLLAAFPQSETAGYIELRVALLESDIVERAEKLGAAMERWKRRPAGAEIMFALGDALQELGRLDDAQAIFQDIIALHQDSFWAEKAGDRLEALAILNDAIERVDRNAAARKSAGSTEANSIQNPA